MERTKRELEHLWLELTLKCQLVCRHHCYASAGPDGTHGTMTASDWLGVIDQAASVGVRRITLIGGEPTLYPHLLELIERARGHAIPVTVYTNLVKVKDDHWRAFAQPGVSLATSFYSADREQHERIVGRDTYDRTFGNITQAVQLGIPIRAGLVRTFADQQVDTAVQQLENLGVKSIRVDNVRPVGRGARGAPFDASALCGRCVAGRAVVLPNGDVSPCVFSRSCTVGNVRQRPFADVLRGERLATTRRDLARHVRARPRPPSACFPDDDDCVPEAECPPTADIGGGNGDDD